MKLFLDLTFYRHFLLNVAFHFIADQLIIIVVKDLQQVLKVCSGIMLMGRYGHWGGPKSTLRQMQMVILVTEDKKQSQKAGRRR